jgi:hypothetical protein
MPKINPVSRKELIFKLKALDFEGPFRATKHQYMIKGKQKIFIPNPHGGKDIGIPLFSPPENGGSATLTFELVCPPENGRSATLSPPT